MKNPFYLFCICVSVIFSCKKEDALLLVDYTSNYTEPINNPQGNLVPNCTTPQIDFVHLDEYVYSRPIFNPTNPNEIAYLRRPFGSNECSDEIWTFNFKTGRTNRVTNKRVCKMDWNILNWIVFVSDEDDVWKVKPSGSELERIVSDGVFSNLIKCNSEGDQFLVTGTSFVSFGTEKIIADLEGNRLQTISILEFEFFSELDWRKNLIVFPFSNEIRKYDLIQDTTIRIEIMENENFNDFNNVQFFNDDEVIFLLEKSLHKLNLVTQIETLIKQNGDNDWFIHFDISIDKKTMLVQKQDFVKMDNCTIQVRNYLALMDIDGSNERRILIPE